MEAIYFLLGAVMIYSMVHYFVISFKQFKKLTSYQKAVQIVAIVCIGLTMIGIMFG